MATNNVVTKTKAKFVTWAPQAKTITAQKRRMRSISYSDAFLAVEWLNAAGGTASYQRVLRVRQELEALGSLIIDLRRRLVEAVSTRDDHKMDEVNGLREQFRKRHNDLNKLLSRYTHVPVFAYNIEAGRWHFGMVPRHPNGREIKLDDQDVLVRVNESSVIAALARLAANHELSKVRICEQCGQRWLVSERQIDRFHNQDCRESYHAKSPGYNDRKAANQRAYRKRLKEAIAAGVSFK